MRKHTALAATVVFGLTLVGCGTSSASGTGPASTPSYCTVYGATNDKIDATFAQVTPTASAAEVHSAMDTIVAQYKTELDSAPPAAIKNDLQTIYDTLVEAERQLAAVSFSITQLPSGPPATKNPNFQQAGKNVAQWAHSNCGTPLRTESSPPPTDPTR